MAKLNCECSYNCAGLAIVAAVVIGIITAILTFTATITVTPAFLWVLFGIAVVYLAVLLIAAATNQKGSARACICSNLRVALTGILGTILFAVVLLAITFAATSLIGAVITGALLAFFTLIVTSVSCLVTCIAGCSAD